VNLPTDWLHAEQAGRTLRFTASRFTNDGSFVAALQTALPNATHPEIRPMSLREIFVALARAYRLEGK
jgi:ABC-2 type transport system ATP-binding protein